MPSLPPLVSFAGNHTEVLDDAKSRLPTPITPVGVLDSFTYKESTPAIGREYSTLQLKDLLARPEGEIDALFKDLAYVVSRRGVVFLRNQDVSGEELKEVARRLSENSGSPASSGLHVHPLTEESSELGDQLQVISSEKQRRGGGLMHFYDDARSRLASAGWHSDITFEPVPSDYALLKIETLPPTGGDTLWASAYEAYSRLSPPFAKTLEGLTATHDGSFFHDEARRLGNPLREGIRGSPYNHGPELKAVHPVVRTNPVTGLKGLFVNKAFTQRINGVTKDESDLLLDYIFKLITNNHDLQVRLQWGLNDVAIWDNRSTWHTATYDYSEPRAGIRACSLGERPYFEAKSTSSREEALDEKARIEMK
ncbi:hypothetical protein P7C70_g4804, partial [Phenoliferia sp. Uapishka_3]